MKRTFKFETEKEAHAFLDWFWHEVMAPARRPRLQAEWTHHDKTGVTISYGAKRK